MPVPDLPVGVTDYATAVRVHGDQISPEHRPGPALDGRSAYEVLTTARSFATGLGLTPMSRVLSTAPWDGSDEVANQLVGVLSAGSSLVLVANSEAATIARHTKTEKVTHEITGDKSHAPVRGDDLPN
jgi:uncharacterized protein (TIGR03089 family)